MSAPSENPVGKTIYFGALLPSAEDETLLEIRILEGLLEEYVPFSGGEISPVVVSVGDVVLHSPGGMDGYVQLRCGDREIGWFLHDFSKERLVNRLESIHAAMAVASEASGFFGLEPDGYDFDGVPETRDFKLPE